MTTTERSSKVTAETTAAPSAITASSMSSSATGSPAARALAPPGRTRRGPPGHPGVPVVGGSHRGPAEGLGDLRARLDLGVEAGQIGRPAHGAARVIDDTWGSDADSSGGARPAEVGDDA